MEKNVTIIDETGKKLGSTYPKRAEGLVKKGRAEYVSDFCIRMPNAHVPAVVDKEITMEDKDMSKVIGFDARGFKIDPTCKGNNVASRMMVTDALGNNVEAYEIGDQWNSWTQISCDIDVEENEDYEFLFAETGDIDPKDSSNAVFRFIVMPIHENPDLKKNENTPDWMKASKQEEAANDDWENRFQYNLIRRMYRPTMEKCWKDSSIRFYRIPFNTGDAKKIRFVFVAFNRPFTIYPVKNFEAYSEMEDYIPGQDFFRKDHPFGNKGFKGGKFGPDGFKGFNWRPENSAGFKEAEAFMGNISASIGKAVRDAFKEFENLQKGFCENGNRDRKHNKNPYSSDTVKDIESLAKQLRGMYNGTDIEVANTTVGECQGEIPGCGVPVTGCRFELGNSTLSGDAFALILKKLDVGCCVDAGNVRIGRIAHTGFFESLKGRAYAARIDLGNATIDETALAAILIKIGDASNVDLSNATIEACDDVDIPEDIFTGREHVVINLSNATIPRRIYDIIKGGLKEGELTDENFTII